MVHRHLPSPDFHRLDWQPYGLRAKAAESIEQLRQAPNVTIVPQTSAQFTEALAFYRGHRDKEWSLTDCASFLIMRESGLTEALTRDHHFEQAGFTALLRGT